MMYYLAICIDRMHFDNDIQPSSPLRFTHSVYETTLSMESGMLHPMVVTTTKGRIC